MPSAGVNVPTNTKIKEQDVNNKLQLYGIYSGKSSGWFKTSATLLGQLLTRAFYSFLQWQSSIEQAN